MRFLFTLLFCIVIVNECFSEPHFGFSGFLDFRGIKTTDTVSWLDSGSGKLRYGSEDGNSREIFRISQVSVTFFAALNDELSAHLQLNVDAEPDRIQTGSRIDLIEGFVSYRPVLSPYLRLRIRGGVFFPPVSLENRGPQWTPLYTITPSAINSWIGEEVRVTGAEAGAVLSRDSTEYSFTGAIFGNNDPAGTLLAWRGWALQDRQTGFTDRLPLAAIPALQPGGLFPLQPDFVEPFREVDGRAGFYTAGTVHNSKFEVNGIFYDNRGKPSVFDGVQYAWKTDFVNAGAAIPLKERFEILGQYMTGRSVMGIGDMVNISFHSYYLLATAAFEQFRITARYDDFRVRDEDAYRLEDDNAESGNAWTFAWMMTVRQKHRIAAELLRVHSQRITTRTEWQFQLNFRAGW